MFAALNSALRRRPFLGACAVATVKTTSADVMVQTVVEGRSLEQIDQRRLCAFSIFGCLWMGAGQYVLFCQVFEAMLPAPTVLHSLGKMALDQFAHVPLLFLPVFYSVDAWVRGEGDKLGYVQRKYEREALTTLKANWCIWVPASFGTFYLIPTHWRIAYVSGVSFISTSVFSVLQGRFLEAAQEDGAPGR